MFSLKLLNKKSFNLLMICFKPFTKYSINCLLNKNINLRVNRLYVKTNPKFSKCFSRQLSSIETNEELIQRPKRDNKRETFVDNENQFAFKVIESLLRQQTVGLDHSFDDNSNCDHILDQFMTICPQEYTEYRKQITDLLSVIKTLSLTQIIQVLQSVTQWPVIYIPFEPLFYQLWSHLDQELVDRLNASNFIDNEELNQYLVIGNLFYALRVANITKFNLFLVQKLSSPDFGLNKTSFLHLMFYINLHRRVDPKLIPTLMRHSENMLKDMDLEEMGVFCMSCFKTETKLSDVLIEEVIHKTITDVCDQTNNIIRTSITKCLRRSYHLALDPLFTKYINKMKALSDNSVLTLTHLLILMSQTLSYDSQLMTQMFDRLYENAFEFRIKDMERVFLCLSKYQFVLDLNKIQTICETLHSNAEKFEINKYPFCLLNIIHYLSILQYYPKSLIELCFKPSFLDKINRSGKHDFRKHLLATDIAISIERHEEFKHLLLPPEMVYRYHKWILTQEKQSQVQITKRGTLINSAYNTLRSEVHQRVQMCHILPFRSYPLVMLFNGKQKTFSLTPNTELKPKMFDNCIAIYVLEMKDYAVIDTLVKGSAQLEIRLLEQLGIKVLAIPWHLLTRYNSSKSRAKTLINEIQKIDKSFCV